MSRPRTLNLVGDVYNYLTVLERSVTDSRKWVCSCVCGSVFETTTQRLRNGRAKSCGCKKGELISKRFKTHGGSGDSLNISEYQSYMAMKSRCLDETRKGYKDYGARGIKVCVDWLQESPNGFLNFLRDMGKRPEGTSLDRIDSKGNYEPANCRWANKRTQSHNTHREKKLNATSKYRGVSLRKTTKTWMARIGNGKGSYEWLGDFETELMAAIAYNLRAEELFGENAILNVLTYDY